MHKYQDKIFTNYLELYIFKIFSNYNCYNNLFLLPVIFLEDWS